MNLKEKAYNMMLKAHEGQKRYDGRDYSVHPVKVISILRKLGVNNDNIIIAGYLHDTLEDTHQSEQEIRENFGDVVFKLVKELTFKDSKNDDSLYFSQIRSLSKDAKIIKVADIIANITDEGYKSNHFIRKRVEALRIIFSDESSIGDSIIE